MPIFNDQVETTATRLRETFLSGQASVYAIALKRFEAQPCYAPVIILGGKTNHVSRTEKQHAEVRANGHDYNGFGL